MRTSTRARKVRETELLDLLDWKRRVVELYAAVRGSSDPRAVWHHWRVVRDELLCAHPQNRLPIPVRAGERLA